jgi:colanic acid/amylovoran biosynthesis glycosyltransferase
LGCPPSKVIVQHLGVDIENYKMSKKTDHRDRIVILQAASYKPKKGFFFSLKAIKELTKTHDNFEFRVIGSGTKDEVAEMEDWVRDFEISEKVKLLGSLPHSEYLRELSQADIFFHPSMVAPDGDTEGGSPVGITEACAMGIPVVATLHADIPEVVLNGNSGLLSPEKDFVGLAKSLGFLIDNPEKLMQFGVEGRMRIEQEYNIDIQIKRLESLYKGIVEKGLVR